jgi:hypothetical protein
MPRNLLLAYIATWVIHGLYLTFLTFKAARLRREYDDLTKQRSTK